MVKRNSKEAWKPIKGYDGLYEISDQGRVRSFVRKWHTGVPRVLKPSTDPFGYPIVRLWRFGRPKTVHVHVLVLSAFIGPRPPGLVCDHIDANPGNNYVGNLRWISYRENTCRGRLPGMMRQRRGSKSYTAKLTEAQVIQIRKRYAQGGVLQRQLAAEFGVCQTIVSRIIQRKTWRHV